MLIHYFESQLKAFLTKIFNNSTIEPDVLREQLEK